MIVASSALLALLTADTQRSRGSPTAAQGVAHNKPETVVNKQAVGAETSTVPTDVNVCVQAGQQHHMCNTHHRTHAQKAASAPPDAGTS